MIGNRITFQLTTLCYNDSQNDMVLQIDPNNTQRWVILSSWQLQVSYILFYFALSWTARKERRGWQLNNRVWTYVSSITHSEDSSTQLELYKEILQHGVWCKLLRGWTYICNSYFYGCFLYILSAWPTGCFFTLKRYFMVINQ